MREFIFYIKSDLTCEPIGKIEAENFEEAIEKAAMIKRLDIGGFLNIFEIKEINK